MVKEVEKEQQFTIDISKNSPDQIVFIILNSGSWDNNENSWLITV